MPHPKSFDPDQALDMAMDLFWANGYEATSVDQLTEHLGVTRPALYRHWGSKQELYDAALRRYRSVAGAAFVRNLADYPEDSAAIIHRRLREIVDEALDSPDRRGCFLVNAAMERAAADPATSAQVADGLSGLRSRLAEALHAARDAGALNNDDPDALARYLVVVIQGLRVVGKALPEPAALDGVVEQAMTAVLSSNESGPSPAVPP